MRSSRLFGDTSSVEGGDIVQDTNSALDDRQRKQSTGTLAQPQFELDQGVQAKMLQGDRMAGLGRPVARDAGGEHVGGQSSSDKRGRTCRHTVEDDGDPGGGSAEEEPGQCRVLETAHRSESADRVCRIWLVDG